MPAPPAEDTRAPPAQGPRSAITVAVVVIAALVVSIVAAAGSVGAVWYSRRSAKSAAVSAAAASATAALDSQRRHDELTPEFDISITAGENGIGDHAEMRVALTGPAGLDRLDEVTIAILDEAGVNHWAHGLPRQGEPRGGPPVRVGAMGVQHRRQRPGHRQQDHPAAVILQAGRQELGPARPDTHPAGPLDGVDEP
jgi:hypothetical protein